ncbi:GNAT family N-acetyltransferase [Pseudomonas sp. DC3000-4b1]|uniref:GNAT family N-acetyltransferase n=1 Tax=unclassified Pseudomonas TaxID=196821 RepID=UPI003CFB840B
MPDLCLMPLEGIQVHELLAFERGNRAFFEARINARPAEYYAIDGIQRALDAAAADRANDRAYAYAVRAGGVLLGRVNLSQVKRQHFHCAELGYRIGEAYLGRGIGSQAVALVMAEAFGPLGLARLQATVPPYNLGSIRVLERNGFQAFGRSRRSFWHGDQWHDLLYFEVHAWQP